MNVVTIDFDIIMKPSIGFYNNMVDPEDPIKNYIEEFSFLANIPADLYIYDYLTRYITRAMVNGCRDVYFINSHEAAISCIKGLSLKEPVTLYNIDHHHDLGYDKTANEWKTLEKKVLVGNWVKYGKEKKYIDNYFWIHNDNSDPFPKEAQFLVKDDFDLKDINLNDDNFVPDVLILCASYEWVPPMYHSLYLAWNSICSEIAGKEYALDMI